MSTPCIKSFIQQVTAPAAAPIVYWSLEGADYPNWFDQSGHGSLMYTPVGPTIIVPGKVGDGAGLSGVGNYIDTNTVAPLGHQGGFSIACWLKVNTYGLGAAGYVSYGGLNFNCYLAIAFSSLFKRFSAKDDNWINQEDIAVVMGAGSWIFIHMFYDNALGKMGYSFDGGSETYASFTPIVTDSISGEFTAAGNASDIVVDEILISPQAKLNATQVSYLYNGGAGRTWPITLP